MEIGPLGIGASWYKPASSGGATGKVTEDVSISSAGRDALAEDKKATELRLVSVDGIAKAEYRDRLSGAVVAVKGVGESTRYEEFLMRLAKDLL
jgi:hypothetical protein